MTDDVCIRKATACDLDAIKMLADANKVALGFVLRPVLAEGIGRESVYVADSPMYGIIGFIHYRHRRDVQTTVYEICVQQDRRCNGIGRALVNALAAEAFAFGKSRIRLKAPVDISANMFYQAIGFSLLGSESGKKRDLNVWDYTLHRMVT